jgi:hypothetical protein
MRIVPRSRAHVRALGLALALSGPIAGLAGCADENPPIGSISAPRSASKEAGKEQVSAKKGDPKAGLGAKERLGLDK